MDTTIYRQIKRKVPYHLNNDLEPFVFFSNVIQVFSYLFPSADLGALLAFALLSYLLQLHMPENIKATIPALSFSHSK